jgi:RNA polymerase sigma factor (sigma-70 family)
MSRFDPKKAPTSAAPNVGQAREITTASGVKVIVAPPPPEKKRWSPPKKEGPSAFVFAPGQPAHEREAFMASLRRQYGPFIEERLGARGVKNPASVEELRQEVLVVFCEHIRTTGRPPDNPEAFLTDVVKKEAWNHVGKRRPLPVGVPDSGALVDSAPDPERAAVLAERREKLRRYLKKLPAKEAEVLRCIELEGMTIQEAADALKRPKSTVKDDLDRAWERLRGFVLESARAAELRARKARAK